jgi:uncharacterized protein (UPF0303 family)
MPDHVPWQRLGKPRAGRSGPVNKLTADTCRRRDEDVADDDQQALIASLEAQEEQLVFTRFANADAWRLGRAMVAAALDRALPVTIDIRRHGQQLFHVALPGTTAENDSWIERKVNVVNRFDAASYLVGRRLAARGVALDEALGVDPRLFAAHGGAFPIRIRDVGVVGTVAVSGLPQADDHAFVTEMIGAFLGDDAPAAT